MSTIPNITLDDVRRALTLPEFDAFEAQMRMAPVPRPMRRPEIPGNPRQAGVLVLLYPHRLDGAGSDEVLHFVLIQRTEDTTVHSGQISLPGGRHENGETFEQTALREAEEEVGVPRPTVQVIGQLTPIYVPPSDFLIHPTVGHAVARPVWRPDPTEVAAILEMPLAGLLDPERKGVEQVLRYEQPFTIAYYQLGPHKVWGATAIMLSELETRLRVALALPADG